MSDEAIPAATLILIRDREQGAPQVLMVERSRDMAFAAGAMVFPGGRIDPSDHRLAAEFATQAPLLAAIRETLEETAIPVGIAPVPSFELAVSLQNAVLIGEPFGSVLRSQKLKSSRLH